MFFIVFLCLASLFRNREVFFFNFLCYLLFFSVQLLCLEKEKSFFLISYVIYIVFLCLGSLFRKEKSFFSISYVIYCFSLLSFSVQKQRSLFFFNFLCYILFFSVQKREVFFFQFLMLFIVFLCLGSLFGKREVPFF